MKDGDECSRRCTQGHMGAAVGQEADRVVPWPESLVITAVVQRFEKNPRVYLNIGTGTKKNHHFIIIWCLFGDPDSGGLVAWIQPVNHQLTLNQLISDLRYFLIWKFSFFTIYTRGVKLILVHGLHPSAYIQVYTTIILHCYCYCYYYLIKI